MQTRVTIIPSDSFISVDGAGLAFPFAAPVGIHAIQWHNGSGHVEYTDGTPNNALEPADYDTEVAPYVALWQTERERLIAEANRPPTPEELAEQRKTEIMARLDGIDAASMRPLRAIARNEAVQNDMDKLAALDGEAAVLRSELAALIPATSA